MIVCKLSTIVHKIREGIPMNIIFKRMAFTLAEVLITLGIIGVVAAMIDVHEKYIGKVESGKQNLTIKTLIKLANALDIKLSKLVDIE